MVYVHACAYLCVCVCVCVCMYVCFKTMYSAVIISGQQRPVFKVNIHL